MTVQMDAFEVEGVKWAQKRIAELEAAHAGQKAFIAKQAAMIRALQRRLNMAGLDSSIPSADERAAANKDCST